MKRFNLSAIVVGISLLGMHAPSMERPPAALNENDIVKLTRALNGRDNPNFFTTKSLAEIETLINLTYKALKDPNALNVLSQNVKQVSPELRTQPEFIKLVINEFIV